MREHTTPWLVVGGEPGGAPAVQDGRAGGVGDTGCFGGTPGLALPGLANLWLIVTKDTALLAVVGFFELASATKTAAGSTRNYLLFYTAAAVIYLCVTLLSNVIFRRIENRYRRGQAAV